MHAIEYLDYPSRKTTSAICKDCGRIADRNGDYKGQARDITFCDKVLADRRAAEEWIRLNDAGWYHSLAIKYKDGRKIMWLVKIEYHC